MTLHTIYAPFSGGFGVKKKEEKKRQGVLNSTNLVYVANLGG
jgi:hypothetical protein